MKDDREPRALFADIDADLGELSDALRHEIETNDDFVSWPTHFKLTVLRLLHPLGLHYMVKAYEWDAASERAIRVGQTCWFCHQ